jgi:excisionase family DNA binding protein
VLVNDKALVLVFTPVKKGADMETTDEPLTQSVRQTAKELGIGVNQAYEAVRRGEIPTIRIGKRILVLRKPLKRLLAGASTSEAV